MCLFRLPARPNALLQAWPSAPGRSQTWFLLPSWTVSMCFFRLPTKPNALLQGWPSAPGQSQTWFLWPSWDGLYVLFQVGSLAKRFIAGLAIRSRTVADVVPLAFMDGLYVSFQVAQPGQTLYCRAGHPLQDGRRRGFSGLHGRSLCVFSGSPTRPNALLQGWPSAPGRSQTWFLWPSWTVSMCLLQVASLVQRFIAGLAIRSRTVADVVPLAFMDGLYVFFSGWQAGQTLYCRAGHPLQDGRRRVLSCDSFGLSHPAQTVHLGWRSFGKVEIEFRV